jgi:hypothetical protein
VASGGVRTRDRDGGMAPPSRVAPLVDAGDVAVAVVLRVLVRLWGWGYG